MKGGRGMHQKLLAKKALGGAAFWIVALLILLFFLSPLLWMISTSIKSYIDAFGYIAARKDVAGGQFEGDELMKAFAAQMQYAQPRGPHPEWPSISDAISLAFNQVIVGTLSPADAAAAAQATIDGIVK